MHIVLKATQRITSVNKISEIGESQTDETLNRKFYKEYLETDKLSDELGKDLALVFDHDIIFGFDYLHGKRKIIIPEINPILIFYSNAIMSLNQLRSYKENLLVNSPDIFNIQGNIDLKDFGNFFQFSVNTIINLQASIESFLNYSIPDNFEYFSKKGKIIKHPNIHDKIDYGIVKSKNKSFEKHFSESYRDIKDLINLRNDIIHLKPIEGGTNTRYKKLFRRLLDFNYQDTANSIGKFLNFYEKGLIEKCPCGKDFFFTITEMS